MKALFLTVLILPLSSIAQDQDDTARLREALKNLTLQLRTAQGETATAQAASIAAEQKARSLEAKVADLEKRNAALAKESNDYKADTDKKTATLNNRLAEREKRLAEYIAALDKWKAAYQSAVAVAKNNEAERTNLAGEVVSLKNTVADRERKNIGLFNTANEILDRFEKFSLGKALSAREPFIQSNRVKVESLVEGYKSDILDNRIAAPAKKP